MYPIKSPKKLIEVALPLDEINTAAVHEKSVRQGHPASIHLYWARRPLAAARAILFAQLVNDPGGERGWAPGVTKADAEKERARLFEIMADLAKWENVDNKELIEKALKEIKKSWEETKRLNSSVKSDLFEDFPVFHDPFSGGGAIPLEAQRLGLKSRATDLNPVALLINRAMIELPYNFVGKKPIAPLLDNEKQSKMDFSFSGLEGLSEDIRRYGELVKSIAFNVVGKNYPKAVMEDGKESHVISWIWARTVESPNPAAKGVYVPLVKSFIISKKRGKYAWVEYAIHDDMSYNFKVKQGSVLPEDIGGTVGRGGAHCIVTGSPIPLSYIREQGKKGRIKSRLMAVAAEGKRGRVYLSPTSSDEVLATKVIPPDLSNVPIEHWSGCTNCVVYGYESFNSLFTKRQTAALCAFSDAIIDVHSHARRNYAQSFPDEGDSIAKEYADAISVYLTMCLNKLADLNNSFCRWESIAQCPRQLYGKQAIPMVWDFAEANPFSNSSGSWTTIVNGVTKALGKLSAATTADSIKGEVLQGDAQLEQTYPNNCVISTDPPYYDNVPYSNLSDFFYLWSRRTLKKFIPEDFKTLHVPKMPELVANQLRHGGKKEAELFFLDGMTKAMESMAKKCHPAFPVTIYYAFKSSETRGANTSSSGWETFISSVIKAGFSISGTWPLSTENASRMRGQNSNALASSIVLVCRKKTSAGDTVSRKAFLRQLRSELPDALEAMIGGETGQSPIAPVDLAQAAIGPGMAIFSNYDAVLNQDGTSMTVHDALVLINRAITEFLHPDSGEFDSDTQFCASWFDQYAWSVGSFGEADILARAKGTTVEGAKEAGILESGSGKVRLLKWGEYQSEWDPTTDKRTPVWEACHQMIRRLQNHGESAAGELLAKMPEKGEAIRQLSYHLYTLCERKKWAEEARAYNELIGSWHAIVAASHETGHAGEQGGLDI